jgi:hypothetical protein
MISPNGWTLVIKAAGTDGTWAYSNAIWSNTATYNPNNYATGLDQNQLKSQLYSLLPFTYMRVGMQAPLSGGAINWAEVYYGYVPHMYSQIADGAHRYGLFDKGLVVCEQL